MTDRGASARELTADVLHSAAVEVLGEPLPADPGDLGAVLDPAAIVATRSALGGAAPAAVDAMVEEIERRTEALVAAAEARRARFEAAETALRGRIRVLADGAVDAGAVRGGAS
jgi:argininosuccinate lyase